MYSFLPFIELNQQTSTLISKGNNYIIISASLRGNFFKGSFKRWD